MAQESIAEQGHWGRYGGRYVPETLMAPLEELTEAYGQAKADPHFQKTQRSNRRRTYLSEARRSVTHGLPQNQQCAWPGTPGPTHG
jgi:tryptophan synthase beta subunit